MTRAINILIFPDFQLLDAAGPITVFEAAGRDFSGGGAPAREAEAEASYRLRVVARDAGPVTSSSGVQMVAETFAGGRPDCPDTLIVAGGWGTRAASACDETLAYIRAAAGQTRRIVSVCSGAFILAAAGLLDGCRATTHWNRAAELARAYPRVRVEPDRIFIRDGAVWTSAGITAGIDLALALVADDLGEAAAKRAAQHLVVYHRRPGGQSQFSALLEADRPGSRFSPLLCWARERLDERLPVERLAERAAMSPRHFARAFAAETGMTPAKAIERLRLEASRERIESGAEPIELVAAGTGFGDPERMRRAFIRAFGQPPQALRRAARADASPAPV
ncbi:MAG TPA: GlxA family transcriptional regulator, partial [Stellaceae bacterium]|nr:GlxA family transcriptional regulator [Stellaceae bacterium]